jgi:hypothetical protein
MARGLRTSRRRTWHRSNGLIRLGKWNGWSSTRGLRGQAQWPRGVTEEMVAPLE